MPQAVPDYQRLNLVESAGVIRRILGVFGIRLWAVATAAGVKIGSCARGATGS